MKKVIIYAVAVGILAAVWQFWPEPAVVTPSPTVTPTPSATTSRSPTSLPSTSLILLDMPFFAAQAPFGEWSDDRFQDGCEEASSVIAVRWARGQSLTPQEMRQEIIAISKFELDTYGDYHDTSAQDTATRIIKGYFNHADVRVVNDITADDIIAELKKGNMVITPMDGRRLGNPYYTAPGPERHMVPVIGYDPVKNQFITHDVGTRQGRSYRYGVNIFMAAVRDYPSGSHVPIAAVEKNMIVVGK